MVLGGEEESVLVTTVDQEIVQELIETHKVDIERNQLINIATAISSDPSAGLSDRDVLDSMLLRRQARD